MLWCYGFHHEQAERHFKALLSIEPNNVLGLWGLTYSLTPFYNRSWSWYPSKLKRDTAKSGYENLEFARQYCAKDDVLVTELVDALCLLYRSPTPASDNSFVQWQQEYATRLHELAQSHLNHPDVITLTSEALLNCTPWALWDIDNRSIASGSRVNEALALLEPALTGNATPSPGVLHMHIHALEMSPFPEKASPSASKLKKLSATNTRKSQILPPHLPHMATHIDVLLGNYQDAIEINRAATVQDHFIYIHKDEFYSISRLHNHHMMIYAAMMAGRKKDAFEAENELEMLAIYLYDKSLDPWLQVSIEGYFANRFHASIRFGCWEKILNYSSYRDSLPDIQYKPFANALLIYARGVALANLGDPVAAQAEIDELDIVTKTVPKDYIINNNPADKILVIAKCMLEGEHLYHRGDIESGLEKLREAVVACDDLTYCEPWPWMHPPRHAYGALLLEQGMLKSAQTVYETDLGFNDILPKCKQNPANIWALQGLAECYERLNLVEKSAALQPMVTESENYADIDISSSCFCRSMR